jgi:isopenicillin-N epimerase
MGKDNIMAENKNQRNTYSDYIKYWRLDDEYIFMNHGSFGATPKAILDKQREYRDKLENEPVRFFIREAEELFFGSKKKLSKFVNADEKDIVFVSNATYGVNAVLKSLVFKSGDELLTTNHEYHSCKNTLDYVAKRNRANVVVADIPFPINSDSEVVENLLKYITKNTKILLIDHVTSPTGLVFPIKQIIDEFQTRGIDVLVDGAHSAGMLDLKLNELSPAYYTGNCHKWMCTPKGSAFLFVREDKQKDIFPVVTSFSEPEVENGNWTKFQTRFYWNGTFDISTFLTVGDTIDYMNNLYPDAWGGIRKHNHELALAGRKLIMETLGVNNCAPDSMIGSLASIPMPDMNTDQIPHLYIDDIQNILFNEYKIEVPVMIWPNAPKRVIRISAQIYNSIEQYKILADALKAILKR